MSGYPPGYLPCIVEACPRPRRSGQVVCRVHYKRLGDKKYRDGCSDGNQAPDGGKKLSPEQVKLAKKRIAAFKTQDQVAKEFGVTTHTLRKYLKGIHKE